MGRDMQPHGQPIFIMPEGTDRTRGKSAQGNNIAAAKAVADAVKSTLGPKGMDKMLVNGLGDVLITNDGATILREINVEHPAAKMVIEVSKTQESQCYDGTTTSVVFAGALLKESEALIEKNVHPTVIASGYRLASSKALLTLEQCVVSESKLKKHVGEGYRQIAMACAETALTGKFTDTHESVKNVIASIAGDAVEALSDGINPPNLDDINVVCATGGSVEDSYMLDGIVLEKEKAHNGMPTAVDGAVIALIDFPVEVKKTEVDARISITSPDQMQDFLDQEEKALKDMVNKFVDANVNVLLCQKKIDDLALHYMAKAGIMALQSCRKSQLSSVSKATGAKVISDLDDLTNEDLGSAGYAMEERLGENLVTSIGGVSADGKAVTVVLRGGTSHIVEEIERAFDDALGVVSLVINEAQVLVGGGATFARMAKELREFASTVAGRKQMAVEAYASALEEIPATIAENAGMDPVDTIIALRKAHGHNQHCQGVYVTDEDVDILIDNMLDHGVIEPLSVVKQAVSSATETATMILRIDDVIQMRQAGPPGPMM